MLDQFDPFVRGKYVNYIYKSIYWSWTDQLLLCSIAYSHDFLWHSLSLQTKCRTLQ
jgi:hypothetical protein